MARRNSSGSVKKKKKPIEPSSGNLRGTPTPRRATRTRRNTAGSSGSGGSSALAKVTKLLRGDQSSTSSSSSLSSFEKRVKEAMQKITHTPSGVTRPARLTADQKAEKISKTKSTPQLSEAEIAMEKHLKEVRRRRRERNL